MQKNLISAAVLPEKQKSILDNLQDLQDTVDFKIVLTDTDKRRASKLGIKRAQQAILVYENVKNFPQFLPPFVDVTEFNKDYDLFQFHKDLKVKIELILDTINSNIYALGDDLSSAMAAYLGNLRIASQTGQPMAGEIYNRISRIRKRYIPPKDETTPPDTTPKPPTSEKIVS